LSIQLDREVIGALWNTVTLMQRMTMTKIVTGDTLKEKYETMEYMETGNVFISIKLY